MRATRNVGLLLGWVLLMLGACAIDPPPPDETQTWVSVRGPAISRWTVPDAMSLEVGNSAWAITPEGGLGVVAADLRGPVIVRLVGVSDCHVYATFEAMPGSRYVIQFGTLLGPEAITVEEVDIMEYRPGLVERANGPLDCP